MNGAGIGKCQIHCGLIRRALAEEIGGHRPSGPPDQGWRWMQHPKQEWALGTFPPQHNTTQPHLPTTTTHLPVWAMGGQRTSPLFAKNWQAPSGRVPISHFPLPIARLSLSSVRSSEQNEGTPGAFPREPSPIKTGLPSFSATLTSTDTLPTITECRRTRTEESLKRVAPVPDMASGPCCCEPGMVNGRRRTQR